MSREDKARAAHRNRTSCSASVYNAFSDINANYGSIPVPRSEGGKCGAVLSAEKTLREMGIENDFDQRFEEEFGSLKCMVLRGRRIPCNDLVGGAARLVEEYLNKK